MKPYTSILVVDDEQANTILFTEVLRKAGYSVTTAHDGFKAIAACKVRAPDLILLDLEMPLMSGVDVVNRLRGEERTRDIPIIFLTRKGEAPPALDLADGQEPEFLTKPPEPAEVLVRIKSALRVKALKEEIKRKEGQIKELSLVDPLTSLRNTRFLNEFLKAEILQSRRYSPPLSVIVLDIDRQKELSRAHGQKAFDSLITQVAAVMSRLSRQSDILARTGVSEFVIVLTHTTREGAVEVAERLRHNIAQSTFTLGSSTVSITVSLGICQFTHDMDDEGKTLLSHARAALAHAHASGGNVTLMAS